MNHGYFSIEAIGSPYNYFFDGLYYYERAKGLAGLKGIDGFLKRIGKKIKKVTKKAVKTVKKVTKKAVKVTKKVAKGAIKVIQKALPIVNTALAFVPGVGWAVSAALSVAEMGLTAAKKSYDRKKAREQAKKLNAMTTQPVSPAKKVNKVTTASQPLTNGNRAVKLTKVERVNAEAIPQKPIEYLTVNDLVKIQRAVQRDVITPDKVAALTQNQVNESLLQILRS